LIVPGEKKKKKSPINFRDRICYSRQTANIPMKGKAGGGSKTNNVRRKGKGATDARAIYLFQKGSRERKVPGL